MSRLSTDTFGHTVTLYYERSDFLKAKLFVRKYCSPHLRSISVAEVGSAIQKFVQSTYSILYRETNASPQAALFDAVSAETVGAFANALAQSPLIVEPTQVSLFPISILNVVAPYVSDTFFISNSASLNAFATQYNLNAEMIDPAVFPPFHNWRGTQEPADTFLGVQAASPEIALRVRAAVLGALALLPHYMERYLFTGRHIISGVASVANLERSASYGMKHTPALAEQLTITSDDHEWLDALTHKLSSEANSDKRQLRALEYYYRAWIPDSARRFPILFGALDAIYGDAGQATQSIIDAIGPVMGSAYTYERLKLLLSVRASVVHGGAPNVYESSKYHDYYEQYSEDVTNDLELIVARCLQTFIFNGTMKERPHTHAALILQHTGRVV